MVDMQNIWAATDKVNRLEKVFSEVMNERRAQDDKWGEQSHPNGTSGMFEYDAQLAKRRCKQAVDDDCLTWQLILDEEVQEAFAESDPLRLREELIQVAAVAVNWIEALDRRKP